MMQKTTYIPWLIYFAVQKEFEACTLKIKMLVAHRLMLFQSQSDVQM